MWRIVFKKRNKNRKKLDFPNPSPVPVRKNRKVTLGRKAEVILREEDGVADVHMALWYDQGRYWIEKEETENILKFNGRALEKGDVRALYNGAVLEIGTTKYQFMEE